MRILFSLGLVLSFAVCSAAQTGGSFDLSHNVIAGGGSNSSGGSFSLDGTIGQPVAGSTSVSIQFRLRSGFWAFQQFGPTAAGVTISGRVTTANGRGIRGTVLTLVSNTGETLTARTNAFGYYKFRDVHAGGGFILSASSSRYGFNDPVRYFNVVDALANIDFIAAASK